MSCTLGERGKLGGGGRYEEVVINTLDRLKRPSNTTGWMHLRDPNTQIDDRLRGRNDSELGGRASIDVTFHIADGII